MEKILLLLTLLLTSCASNYLDTPLPTDKGYINYNNGVLKADPAMWTQVIYDGVTTHIMKNVPFTNKTGCAHFLIGVANGKTKDIRITERHGSSEAIKFLVWKYKNQEWEATDSNPKAKPAVVKQFANLFMDDAEVSTDLAKKCDIKVNH